VRTIFASPTLIPHGATSTTPRDVTPTNLVAVWSQPGD
jgi:hypothetical protein